MKLSGILDLTGRDEGPDRGPKARAFELFLMIHATTRLWLWSYPFRSGRPEEIALAVAMSACLVFYLHPPSRRLAVILAAGVLLIKQSITFPLASNHSFIECSTMALLAFMGTRGEDAQRTVLQAARMLTVIVFFYSGVQKVLHGTYFDGQYLSYSIANHSRFLSTFGQLVPADELERLLDQKPIRVGSGPFTIDATWFVLMSNMVYVFEIVTPIFLLIRKTRTWAACACLGFTVAIEVGAREFMFGALFVNLLLLFLPKAVNRFLIPLWILGYLFLLGVEVGVFPDFYFN